MTATPEPSAPPPLVRRARPADLRGIVELCFEHAEYERAPSPSAGLERRLESAFFPDGGPARASCFVAAVGQSSSELAGFAVASEEFSTWDGGCYLHLDCLYVRAPFRGRGLGQELLRHVAEEAVRRESVNLQWQTPDWNADAIRFYDRLGGSRRAKQRFTLEPEAYRRWARA